MRRSLKELSRVHKATSLREIMNFEPDANFLRGAALAPFRLKMLIPNRPFVLLLRDGRQMKCSMIPMALDLILTVRALMTWTFRVCNPTIPISVNRVLSPRASLRFSRSPRLPLGMYSEWWMGTGLRNAISLIRISKCENCLIAMRSGKGAKLGRWAFA